jgi:hypothetical protein
MMVLFALVAFCQLAYNPQLKDDDGILGFIFYDLYRLWEGLTAKVGSLVVNLACAACVIGILLRVINLIAKLFVRSLGQLKGKHPPR